MQFLVVLVSNLFVDREVNRIRIIIIGSDREGLRLGRPEVADDTIIWKKIQNKQEDIEALQQDLLTLESWSEKWLLSFNTDKCKVMNLGAVDNGRYFFTR